MITAPAKNPEETKKLMVTYQSKVKDAEEHNRPLSSDYLKSILGGIIDEKTRIHTYARQHKHITAEEFENKIMAFVMGVSTPATSMSPNTATPMQVGAMATVPEGPDGGDTAWWGDSWSDPWTGGPCGPCGPEDAGSGAQGDQPEALWALKGGKYGKGKGGKGGKGVCHGCGAADHYVANCPYNQNNPYNQNKGGKGKDSKGKGQGHWQQPARYGYQPNSYKGGNPNGSKGGSGKGPRGGCWKCGGPHYADACTGKGNGQVRALEQGQVRVLASLKHVNPKEKETKFEKKPSAKWIEEAHGQYAMVQNKFQVLGEEDDDAQDVQTLANSRKLEKGGEGRENS